jgi:hypothetical protein
VNRRLLLTAAEQLSAKQWKRLGAMLDYCDRTNEIGAAWGVKERLRMLLAEYEPSKIRRRLMAEFSVTRSSPPPTVAITGCCPGCAVMVSSRRSGWKAPDLSAPP